MKSLWTLKGDIEFGRWSGHLPNMKPSYLVTEATYDTIQNALDHGDKVRVGNSPKRTKGLISKVNSRYHGFCIRTIHIID
jgi:hypothetical protein